MTVAAPTKTVKHINTQRRVPTNQVRNASAQGRSVTMERTRRESVGNYDRNVGGRSVTIGSRQDENKEDYEELF